MSENAAASAAVSSVVEGLLAREEEDERREESLQNTATRLAEDLAQVKLTNNPKNTINSVPLSVLIQPIKYLLLCSSSNALLQVISSRVTGMVGEEGRSGAAPQYSFAGSAGGLLSSLQELLPTSQVAILVLVS